MLLVMPASGSGFLPLIGSIAVACRASPCSHSFVRQRYVLRSDVLVEHVLQGPRRAASKAGMTKRLNFWMVKDSEVPASGLCKYADARPTVRKTNDSIVAQERELQRNSLMKVIDGLSRHPDLASSLDNILEERIDRKAVDEKAIESGPTWEVSTVGALDENWAGAWIMGKTRKSKTVIERAKNYEPEVVRHHFAYMNNVTNGLSLQEECLSKQVTSLAFDKRWASQGERLNGISDAAVFGADGQVKRLDIGHYQLVSGANNKVTKVVHKAFAHEAAVPEDIHITRGHSRVCLHRRSAQAVKGISKQNIAIMSGRGRGPYASKTTAGKSNILDDLVAECLAELEQRLNNARAGELKEHHLDLRNVKDQAAKGADARRAREALARRHEFRVARRRCALGAGGAPPPAPIADD